MCSGPGGHCEDLGSFTLHDTQSYWRDLFFSFWLSAYFVCPGGLIYKGMGGGEPQELVLGQCRQRKPARVDAAESASCQVPVKSGGGTQLAQDEHIQNHS